MNTFVSIVVLVVLLLLLAFARRTKTNEKARPVERRRIPTKSDTKYHAVTLRFLPSACDAAKALEGERILSAEAPLIPLPDCDARTCKCRFVHHKDRRVGEDRRNSWGPSLGGGGSTGSYEKEQRKSGDRRDDPPDDIF